MKSQIRIVLLIVLIVILGVSLSFLGRDLLQSRAEEAANDELADEVNRLRESVRASMAAASSAATAPPASSTSVTASAVTQAAGTSAAASSSASAVQAGPTGQTEQTGQTGQTEQTERAEQTGRTRPSWLNWLFGQPAQIDQTEPTAGTEPTTPVSQTTQGGVPAGTTQAPQTTTAQTADDSGILPQYASLYKRNNDLAGWLTIPGTDIDNAVMYTPYDLEKYLHLGFSGKYAASGSLFLGQGYSSGGNYAIIYGHHMRNGMMFSDLLNYASASFASSHPTIYFDTLYQERSYTVVAAFYSKVYPEDEADVFRYYAYVSLPTPEIFDDYMSNIRDIALYDTGAGVSFGDRLLVLSTCGYHTDDGRFAVLARQN